MRTTHIGAAMGLSLLLSVTTTACGSREANETQDQVQSAGSEADAADEAKAGTPVPLEKVDTAFSMFAYDYDPVDAPQDLEGRAELVISGSVTEVVAGRSESRAGVDRPPVRNAAVGVEIERLLKGSATVGDVVWLELPTDPSILRPGLPEGARLALYLSAAAGSDEVTSYSTSGSKIPAGANLWTFVHPQGLILQYGAQEGMISPAADSHSVDPEATVEDVLPEG